MTNSLKKMTARELISSVKMHVGDERKKSAIIIEHLVEIDRRQAYKELGFRSLFDFCVEYLGYDNGQTHRRMSAVKIANKIPELEIAAKVEEGRLSLASLGHIGGVLKSDEVKELKPHEQKKILNELVEIATAKPETSKQEAAKNLQEEIAKRFPEASFRDRQKTVSEDRVEIKIFVSKKTAQELEELKDFKSHSLGKTKTTSSLIELLAADAHRAEMKKRAFVSKEKKLAGSKNNDDRSIASLNGKAKLDEQAHKTVQVQNDNKNKSATNELCAAFEKEEIEPPGIVGQTELAPKSAIISANALRDPCDLETRIHIAANVRRIVFTRAKNKCENILKATGKRCNSKHFLQIDHKIALVNGGSNDESNYQILCWECHVEKTQLDLFTAFQSGPVSNAKFSGKLAA